MVALSASVSDTIAFINQLGQVLVEGGAALTTAELIRPLEDALSDRWLSVLDEATNAPGATASSVVKAILKDKPTGGAGGSAQRDGPLDEQEKVEPSINAIELAITKAPFRAVAAALRGIDTSTATGRLDGIAEGFRGECVLAVRALLTPRPLHSKNETLALLTDLHKYLGDYFTYVLAADGTGQVPARMQKYSFLGPPDERGKVTPQGQAFLDSFTKFDLVSMDWLYAPGGLLAYLRYRNTQGAVSADPLVHPLDVYTVPDQVAALGKMIHSLLVAVGAADTVADEDTDGYTFSAWTEMYIEHLRLANDYDTLELRYDHLEHCHQLYTSALHKAGQRLRDAVFSQLPADKRIDLGVVPPGDEAPVKTLNEKASAIAEIADLRHKYGGVLPLGHAGPSTPAHPFQLPLRSQNPKHAVAAAAALKLQPGQGTGKTTGGKRKFGEEGGSLATVSSGPPGSLVASWMWLKPKQQLFISGVVFNVAAVAKHLGVSVGSKCWVWLLSRKNEVNKPAICDRYGKPGHADPKDAAHSLDKPFDLNAIMADPALCRYPTEEERQQLASQMEAAGLASTTGAAHRRGGGKGKGRGKGTGRGKGKGAGRGKGKGKGGDQDFHPPSGD